MALGAMTDFEKVVEMADYYDGPRAGVALLRGQPHAFRSRMLDVYGADDTLDIFDLAPLGTDSPTLTASAEFRRVGSGPMASDEWPVFEVRWSELDADAS